MKNKGTVKFAMLLLSVPSLCADYYVSPRGADSNPGTVKRPFRTIQRAANIVHAGDTVNVADGTYNECNVSLNNSGTSNAPIRFQSQNKWGAKLAIPLSCDVGFNVRGSFVVIKNFDISGAGQPSSTGIFFNSGSNHTAFGNKIHNIANVVQNNLNGNVGIFVETANDLIDSNVIFGIGRLPGSNTFNHDHGMYIDGSLGAAGTIVQNNLLYNNTVGYNIQLYPGTLNNILIVNNTIDATGSHNAGCMVQGGNLTNSRIANNICTNPKGGVMIHNDCCGDTASNVLIDHNITSAPGMVELNNTYNIDSSNIFNANPSALFSNLGGNDYHLVANSPAIGAGTSNRAPAIDFDGNARGRRKCVHCLPRTASTLSDLPNDYKGAAPANPPCIGAFEYAP